MVPLYAADAHSATATAIMEHVRDPVLITPFGEVELCNALQLRVFRSNLTPHAALVANQAFERDILQGIFFVQPFSPPTLELAKRLSRQHTAGIGTRTLDLMHVASAITFGASAFLSFDNNQRKLAQAVGLTLHPKTL